MWPRRAPPLKADLIERAGAPTGAKMRRLEDALRFALGLD